jgi:hypothetical protein
MGRLLVIHCVVSAEEKPPATVRRRLSGETVGIDLWL